LLRRYRTDKLTTEQIVEKVFISEGDLYRLIVRSKLPEAEKFERWVFDVVLPSVLATGSYSALPPFADIQTLTIDNIPIEIPLGVPFSVTRSSTGELTVLVNETTEPKPKAEPVSEPKPSAHTELVPALPTVPAYKIDPNRTDNHANVSYAASLYFEGRENADDTMTLEPSALWDFIDIISLDRCIGHHTFGVPTAVLVAESGQVMINAYVAALGLPVENKTFLMNRTDLRVIRYDADAKKWVDDGMRLEPGTVSANHFNNRTTDELLAESGQSRLNAVALA